MALSQAVFSPLPRQLLPSYWNSLISALLTGQFANTTEAIALQALSVATASMEINLPPLVASALTSGTYRIV